MFTHKFIVSLTTGTGTYFAVTLVQYFSEQFITHLLHFQEVVEFELLPLFAVGSVEEHRERRVLALGDEVDPRGQVAFGVAC